MSEVSEQIALLRQLVDLLRNKQSLGFCESPKPEYIYCNRSRNSCLWYRLNDARDPVSIPETALACVVEKLEFKQVERRQRETWKLHLHVRADRRYVLESGHDSVFSKSLMSSLAAMTVQQLQQPITIEVEAADSEEVLFCRIYSAGELVFAPWDASTNWKQIASQAVANVAIAQGGGL